MRGTGGVVQADNPALTGVQRITPEGRVYDGLESSIWERFDKSFYNQMDFMADVAQGIWNHPKFQNKLNQIHNTEVRLFSLLGQRGSPWYNVFNMASESWNSEKIWQLIVLRNILHSINFQFICI